MNNSHLKYGRILTYLGVLPFWITAIAFFLKVEEKDALLLFNTYGSIIVSFISGIHWTISLQKSHSKTIWLIFTSNIIALMAWGAIIIPKPIISLSILTCSFILLLCIDFKIYKIEWVELWFIKMRTTATFLVMLPMLLMLSKFL